MESWGFELVADQFRFPRLLLKVPYDKVGEETEHFDYHLALIQKILHRIEISSH